MPVESRIARVYPEGKIRSRGEHRRVTLPTGSTMQGGIIDRDMPIDASNVMIVCDKCGPTRIGARVDEKGHKQRVCVKCGGEL
jgi:large subunit ribosomal protein L24